MSRFPIPLPIFDTLTHVCDSEVPPDFNTQHYFEKDILTVKQFLEQYNGNISTFNSYRREIERVLHWANLLHKKSLF